MKIDHYCAEERLKGKFPCRLEAPRMNPAGKSNPGTLQVSLRNIFQGSNVCVN